MKRAASADLIEYDVVLKERHREPPEPVPLMDDMWIQICLHLISDGYVLRTLVALRRTCKLFHDTIVAPVPNPSMEVLDPDRPPPILWLRPKIVYHVEPLELPQEEAPDTAVPVDLIRQFLRPQKEVRYAHTVWANLYVTECSALIADEIHTTLSWPLNLEPHGVLPCAGFTVTSICLTKSEYQAAPRHIGPLSLVKWRTDPFASSTVAASAAMARAWPFGAVTSITSNGRHPFREWEWTSPLVRDDDPFKYRLYHCDANYWAICRAYEGRKIRIFKYICHARVAGDPNDMSTLNRAYIVGELLDNPEPAWILYFFLGAAIRADRAVIPQSDRMINRVAKILQQPPDYLREYLAVQQQRQQHARICHISWQSTLDHLSSFRWDGSSLAD